MSPLEAKADTLAAELMRVAMWLRLTTEPTEAEMEREAKRIHAVLVEAGEANP